MKDLEELPSDFIKQFHEKVGKNVQKIRKEKNISQLKLSIALGYKSTSSISCAEIHHNNIHFNLEHLAKIAYALDVEICDFFK